MMPRRIQLRRTKGWRKPAGAIVVARPTRWSNPVKVGSMDRRRGIPHDHASAVERFLELLETYQLDITEADIKRELAGADLCCWCAPDKPCHADVLLEIANQKRERDGAAGDLFEGAK